MSRKRISSNERFFEEIFTCEDLIVLENLDIEFEIDFSELLCGKEGTVQRIEIRNVTCPSISFGKIIVERNVSILNSTIKELDFCSCRFGVNDENHSFDLQTNSISKLVFSDCIFNGKVDLLIEKLSVGIEFEDCIFKDSLLFSNIKSEEELKISFTGEKAQISGNCVFRFCEMRGILDIRADIAGELSLCGVNNKDTTLGPDQGVVLNIEGCVIENVRFFMCELKTVNITNSIVKNLCEYKAVFKSLQDDAPRVFRDAAIRNNDELNIQKYAAVLYDKLLKDSTSLQDKIVLFFNKYSNDYNRSWLRGVCFTAIVTVLLYFILNYIGMEDRYFEIGTFNGYDKVLLGYISLMDITKWLGDELPFELTSKGKIIFFIGRIFIVYGIWQTIYAFYKFWK